MKRFTQFFIYAGIAILTPGLTAFGQSAKDADSINLISKELVISVTNASASESAKKEAVHDSKEKSETSGLITSNAEAVVHSNMNKLHPMAISFVKSYVEVNTSRLEKMKTWGESQFRLIDNILTRYKLPEELKYLAVIESDLKATAKSRVGAVGPWQFMPETGRILGLKINNYKDERRDLFKSTHAAAKYLRDLYAQLSDWLLVIAAYNGGPGRVESAIRKSKSRDFWKLQYYLPAESRNHVKKFIATHYIMEGKGGITTTVAGTTEELSTADKALLDSTETQAISGRYNSMIIVKNIGMDIITFNKLNPGFDASVLTGEYLLRLPADKMQLFSARKLQILNESVQFLLTNSAEEGREEYPQEVKFPPAGNSSVSHNRRK